jgi:hypothetical protein
MRRAVMPAVSAGDCLPFRFNYHNPCASAVSGGAGVASCARKRAILLAVAKLQQPGVYFAFPTANLYTAKRMLYVQPPNPNTRSTTNPGFV